MKEEWRKYDPTGKLFPKEEGQSTIPILIEFPYELCARPRNSYYKKLLSAITILGVLAVFILLSWMSLNIYTHYAADTPSDMYENVDSKLQSSTMFYESYTTDDSYMEPQTIPSILMTMTELNRQEPILERLSEEKSEETYENEPSKEMYSNYINKGMDESNTEHQMVTTDQMSSPETEINDETSDNISISKSDMMVENKFMKQLEEVWKKLLNDAENENDGHMTKASTDDDIKSENKHTNGFAQTQENIGKFIESSVTNASVKSKPGETHKDESLEKYYSDFIDKVSDESGIEDTTEITTQPSSTETEDVITNRTNIINDQFNVFITKLLNNMINNAKLQNQLTNNSTMQDENAKKTTESLVTNASSENNSEKADENESSGDLNSDYYDESSEDLNSDYYEEDSDDFDLNN